MVRVGSRVRAARAVSAASAVRHAVRGTPYYGEVAAADAALAPLLDDVRSSGRPTLVIVTGDHGEGLGRPWRGDARDLRLRIDAADSADHRRGGRREAGSAPASAVERAPAGEVSSVAARHIDILPTILDAVGQPVPSDLPGRTLLSRQERIAGAAPRATYFEAMSEMLNHGWAPLTGVLVDRDKFIDLPIAERYDLANDPASARISPAAPRSGTACSRPRWLRSSRRCRVSASRRNPRRPPACVRSGTSRATRRRRRATPRPTTRSGSWSSTAPSTGRSGLRRGPVRGGGGHLPAGHRAPPRHGHRVPPPGVHRLAAGESGRRHRGAAPGGGAGRDRPAGARAARRLPDRRGPGRGGHPHARAAGVQSGRGRRHAERARASRTCGPAAPTTRGACSSACSPS